MVSAKPFIKLDQHVAEIMQTAIESTLHGMFNMSVRCEAPAIGKGPFAKEPYVASAIDMVQPDGFYGVFVVTFGPEAVRHILQACSIRHMDDPKLVRDAVDEVTNVIYGDVKKHLNQMNYSFVLKVPRTIDEKFFLFEEYRDSERLDIPFSADGFSCHAAIMTKK